MSRDSRAKIYADVEKYPGLDFGREELSRVMQAIYHELTTFIRTPAFQAIYSELMSLPKEQRPSFVTKVLLDSKELARRGVMVPEGILIQTSSFGDRRPTLFAVKKFLPEKYHAAWENVNWTFNNEFDDEKITRDPVDSWRPPLPVGLQNALIATGADLESLPGKFGVKSGAFAYYDSIPKSETKPIQAKKSEG